jgi:hypothetical protein
MTVSQIRGKVAELISSLPEPALDLPLVKENVAELQSIFQVCGEPFQGLETERLRTAEFVKEGLVLPECYVIGMRSEVLPDGSRKLVPAQAEYVSIIDSLLGYAEGHSGGTRCEGTDLRSYIDGDIFKNDDYFHNNSDALRLVLYNDDIETANALGSRSGVHKLTMFYIYVQGSNSSKLSSIHLVIAAYASDLKQFGYDAVLKPLIADLKKLDSGIPIHKGTNRVLLKARLVQLVGDNLAANQTIGMVSSFSAKHFCRFCIMSSEQTQYATVCPANLLRTKENHALHVSQAKDHASSYKNHGVKNGSSLDDLPYFSCIESTVPDIMHDLLEGICKKELLLVLQCLVQDRLITLDELNNRLVEHNYGYVLFPSCLTLLNVSFND